MLKKILLAAVPVLCLLPADAKTIYVSNAGNDNDQKLEIMRGLC